MNGTVISGLVLLAFCLMLTISGWWFLAIILAVPSIALILAGASFANRDANKAKMLSYIENEPDFSASKKIISASGKSILGIDTSRKTIVIRYCEDSTPKFIDCREILSVNLFEDGNTIASANGALGAAAVGGALFGGAGAIVGSNVAAKTSKSKVSQMSLRFTLLDANNPMVDFEIADWGVSYEKDNPVYKAMNSNAREIIASIQAILHELSMRK